VMITQIHAWGSNFLDMKPVCHKYSLSNFY
jgi:hypothetical protein